VKLTKPKPLDFPLDESRIIRLDTTDLNVCWKNEVNSFSSIDISKFPT